MQIPRNSFIHDLKVESLRHNGRQLCIVLRPLNHSFLGLVWIQQLRSHSQGFCAIKKNSRSFYALFLIDVMFVYVSLFFVNETNKLQHWSYFSKFSELKTYIVSFCYAFIRETGVKHSVKIYSSKCHFKLAPEFLYQTWSLFIFWQFVQI